MNNLKVVFLLGLLTGILVVAGGAIGGQSGLVIAFMFAIVLNFFSYWFSDRIVLAIYRAKALEPQQAPALHRIVAEVAMAAGIPKPKVAIIPEATPNAFATGRNPQHGVVAVTQGILDLLDEHELKGVIAHEIGHIKNRDTLIQCIAATFGGAITMLASMARWAMIFGGRDDDDSNPIVMLAFAILAPIAAILVQMAISRTREYQADASAASFTHNPHGLASALAKLGAVSGRIPMRSGSPSTAHLFIVNPFKASFVTNMFSTHPPIEERIERLRTMRMV